MLRNRLILINSGIIIISVLALCLGAVSGLNRLFYRESSLIYDAQLEKSYASIEQIFSGAEDIALNICTSPALQQILREQDYSAEGTKALSGTFDTALNNITQFTSSNYSAALYPVSASDNVLMRDEDGSYSYSGLHASSYDTGYGFIWQFRPDDRDVIRVVRKMYDSQDIRRVIGLVVVEVNISAISDPFWTFAAQSNTKGRLYLLDENDGLLLPYSSHGAQLSDVKVSSMQSASYELRNERVTVVRSFFQNDWKLVGVIEGASLMVGSMDLIRSITWAGILLVAFGIVMTALMANRLTRPIMRLAEWMKASTESGTYRKTPRAGAMTGETRVLYDTYDGLMTLVNQSIDEIKKAGKREVENQFLLLQAQINPHFLYNTLDSIGWIAMQHGAADVRDMVIDLAGMFRNSLNSGKPLIRVENEVEQARCYCNIMMARYPDTYAAEYDVEDGVENLLIIKQILQPLAENALLHGFGENSAGEKNKGTLRISVKTEEENLVLSVSNDGQPADLEKIKRLLDGDEELSSKHYGIRNVNERLKSYYGQNSCLRFSHQNGETVVEISIPLILLTEDEG